jgi:hypothetical protein
MPLDEFGNVIPFYASDPSPAAVSPSPAVRAQSMALTERSSALRILSQWFNQIMQQKVPFDERVLASMVNKEAERNSAAVRRLTSTLRQRAAASGLGVTGGTLASEQDLLEAATRRTASAERDIRARAAEANAQFRQAQVALAGQPQTQLAGIHLGTGFQLPDIGFGSLEQGLQSSAERALQSATDSFQIPTYFGDVISPSGDRRRGRPVQDFSIVR